MIRNIIRNVYLRKNPLASLSKTHGYQQSVKILQDPASDPPSQKEDQKKEKQTWLTPNQEWAIGGLALLWIIFSVLNWEYRWIGECPVTGPHDEESSTASTSSTTTSTTTTKEDKLETF